MFSFFSPTSYGNSIVADCSVTSCHLFIIFFSIYKDFIFYRNLYFTICLIMDFHIYIDFFTMRLTFLDPPIVRQNAFINISIFMDILNN